MQYSAAPILPPAGAAPGAPADPRGRTASPSHNGAIYRMGTVTRIFL